MKVAEYVVEFLNKRDVRYVFGYIGGYNQDVIDALHKDGKIKFVLNYHEQASAFAVDSYSAVTGQVGVATSSGAPSSCNLVAGIADAYFDSHPCLFIAGSAHSLAVRRDNRLRQNTFEEIDMVHLVSDITKYAVKIVNPQDIRYELEKAFYLANHGRKGPVLIDLPYDIARTEIDVSNLKEFVAPNDNYEDFDAQVCLELLKKAKKPVILLGGGATSQTTRKLLEKLLQKVKIPCVASLCGLDVLGHDHECFSGFIGHYGNRYANLALSNADCIFVLGSRLDERQLGGYQTKFSDECSVIRVDIDKVELGRKIPEIVSIYNSVEFFLDKFSRLSFDGLDFSKWIKLISVWKERFPSFDFTKEELSANNFLHMISEFLPQDAVICADVGQNQMCVAQSLQLKQGQRIINSAGYGSMGFSLPAAIGAAYARPGVAVFSINGDGGLQMNIQELQTLVRDKLPVNIIVLNNTCLGMIRRLQESMYEDRNYVSVEGYSVPDFEKISKAYGIKYLKIKGFSEYANFNNFFSKNEPTLTEVILPLKMVNLPEAGCVMDRQTPLLTDDEYLLVKKEACF